MPDREIELDRQRGDFVEVPKGPLDRPRILYIGMAFWGGMSLVSAWMAWRAGGAWVVTPIPFAVMFGVCLCGLLPGTFFRRDRT